MTPVITRLATEVARDSLVALRLPSALPAAERASAVVLTGHYGEAGAVERSGPTLGLPRAYSGHHGFAEWGPPHEGSSPVIAVGLREETLRGLFADGEPVGRVDDGTDLDNDEQGGTVWLCRGPLQSWETAWPLLRRLG